MLCIASMVSVLRKLVLASVFSATPAFAADVGFVPPTGMVPDAETAIAVAVAVLKPIYGAKKIESERPFHAHLNGEVWHVYGSLPAGWVGGVAEVELSRKDGQIVRFWHGQ